MKISGTKLIIAMAICFVILFLMNYIGNEGAVDRIYRASLVGFAGAVGLGISLWYMNKKSDDNDHHHFD
jgi:hypothetical protein